MLVAHSFRAGPGEWVWLDGHQYEIRALAGDTSLRLISPTAPPARRVITLPLAMLISDPAFRPCTADEDPDLDDEAAQAHRALTDTVAAMDGLARADPGELERLTELQGHMLELTTGYRSGDQAVSAVDRGEPAGQAYHGVGGHPPHDGQPARGLLRGRDRLPRRRGRHARYHPAGRAVL